MTESIPTKEMNYPQIVLIRDLNSLRNEYERIIKSVNGVAPVELKSATTIIEDRMIELEMAIHIISDMKFI